MLLDIIFFTANTSLTLMRFTVCFDATLFKNYFLKHFLTFFHQNAKITNDITIEGNDEFNSREMVKALNKKQKKSGGFQSMGMI